MIIKEAFLQEEIEKVTIFLSKFSLILDKDITKTFYMEDEDNIVGTISCANYIIKDLAVDPNYQSENVAGKLVNEMINYFAQIDEKIIVYFSENLCYTMGAGAGWGLNPGQTQFHHPCRSFPNCRPANQ